MTPLDQAHGVGPREADLPLADPRQGTGSVRVRWAAGPTGGTIRHTLGAREPAPGQTLTPPRLRVLGTSRRSAVRRPDYQLLDSLGQGGMGEVRAARQLALNRIVAIKQLPEFGVTTADRERFRAEALITSGLDHPNIIPIYDLAEDEDGRLFFAMKLVQGKVWASCFAHLGLIEQIEILIKVCDGITFAHAKGVIHGDLKPDNVMIGEFGEVLVMDWGLACRVEDLRRRDPEERLVSGTPAYLAPEMARADHRAIGPQSDVYLLGACLYEIITGSPPHVALQVRECVERAADNVLARPLPPGELSDIARRALATDPADRHPGAKAFQAALRDYLSHVESASLTQRAAATLEAARSSGRHEEFGRAIAGHEQALILWSGNRQALEGLRESREAFARHAIGTGDVELASALAESLRPEHPEVAESLFGQVAEALHARRSIRIRMRWLTVTAVAACGLVVLISVAAAILARNERRAVIEAIRDRDEAELRLAALEHRGWVSVIAENFNGDRLPGTIRALNDAWMLQDHRLLAKGPGTAWAEITASEGALRMSFDLGSESDLTVHLGVDRRDRTPRLGQGGVTILFSEKICTVQQGNVLIVNAPITRSVPHLTRHVLIDAREGSLEVIIDGQVTVAKLTGLGTRDPAASGILLGAEPGANLDNLRIDRFTD